ncbi:hypothetical protein PsorP6_008484 [Peronosclerospora sorghi]|uniref:Uncharacterized protein n=1 Tax=Peronosclerospora sorghi TaxID=230839 RepID=A0ACC0W8U0_9STRA|nr:hypothetical protein PsorP6_008484 [Peronosclerospora sorghi]
MSNVKGWHSFFTAGGFALTHVNSVTDIACVELVKVEEIDPEAAQAGLTKYQAQLASAPEGSEEKLNAQIGVETHAAMYASEIDAKRTEAHQAALGQFVQLKTEVDLVRSPSDISRHVLLRYFSQLEKFKQRFPCDTNVSRSSSTRSSLQLQFTWNDSFCPRQKSTQTGVSFEQAAVMFNVGALESQLGVQADRSTAEGLKTACHHFMRAAGAFSDVNDKIVAQTIGYRTPDMSAEGLGLLKNLMLAQAQACFYEKAVKDQIKDAIKAMLVQQALDYYVTALDFCRSSALAGFVDKSWGAHLQFQVHCMRAAAQYWQGTASKSAALDRGQGYGEEIARLDVANTECNEACKVATQDKLPTSLLQSAQALQRVVREHLEAARKDNASVYLENVPNFSDLPVVGKVTMVKPLVFTTGEMEKEFGGLDLFEQYVPKEILLRADVVKDEIKTMIEKTAEKVSQSKEATKDKLHSMGLPASIEAFEKTSDEGLPRSIWQRIQYVKATISSITMTTHGSKENSVVLYIQQQVEENENMCDDVEKKLHSIESLLRQEEIEDNVCRRNYGETKWVRPQSTMFNQDFLADSDRYKGLVMQAKTSDGIIREKVDKNHERLDALSWSKTRLDQELPQLQHDNFSCKEEIGQLSSLLLRLGQLLEEKDQVLGDFRASYDKFNALPVLLSANKANGLSTDAALELEKQFFRDHYEVKMSTIIEEEQALLRDLVEVNDRFEAKKETDHVLRDRQTFLQHLSDAVDVFEQLESHVKEGVKFYRELSTRVSQLHQTVADHCSARELEKRELEMSLSFDDEMRQREVQDASLAQKMMEDMSIRDAVTDPYVSDKALAEQLAANTPQQYASTQQGVAPHPYYQAGLQSPQQYQHPDAHYQRVAAYENSSAIPPLDRGFYNRPDHHQQPSNIHWYPGQHYPRRPAGDSHDWYP